MCVEKEGDSIDNWHILLLQANNAVGNDDKVSAAVSFLAEDTIKKFCLKKIKKLVWKCIQQKGDRNNVSHFSTLKYMKWYLQTVPGIVVFE